MKLSIKAERSKQLAWAFIGLGSVCLLSIAGNVLTGSLAWHFATTQKTITTPMTFNQPFSSDASSADSTGMTMFATSFAYWRLNVSPETIDNAHKILLSFVPAEFRDRLKKQLDIEAERIKKSGITSRLQIREIRVVDTGIVDISTTLSTSTTNGSIITPLKDQAKTFRLTMSYESGLIRLKDFSELVPVTTPTN